MSETIDLYINAMHEMQRNGTKRNLSYERRIRMLH
jgi:hypothetical protein